MNHLVNFSIDEKNGQDTLLIDKKMINQQETNNCVLYLKRIFELSLKISSHNDKNNDKNKFISDYVKPNSNHFVSESNALIKINQFYNGNFKNFISIAQNYSNEIEILIAGSTPLASVLNTEYSFVPGDLDIYVIDLDEKKLYLIDKIIREAFVNKKIILIRKLLTISWVIDLTPNILMIQLSMTKINHWSEKLGYTHSDMTSLGFDINKNKFICLTERWNCFVSCLDNNEPQYFCNILVMSEENNQLHNATLKYKKRGFQTEMISSKMLNLSNQTNPIVTQNHNLNVSGDGNHHSHLKNEIHEKFKNELISYVYSSCFYYDLYKISSNVFDFDIDFQLIPKLINLRKIHNTNVLSALENDVAKTLKAKEICPIIIENTNLFVKSSCKHEISLQSLITSYKKNVPIIVCPLCRKHVDYQIVFY